MCKVKKENGKGKRFFKSERERNLGKRLPTEPGENDFKKN